jgi:malate dehydrogenase
MKKVSIIGAGQVGGVSALRIAESGLADVVLIDIAENLACAKAYDLEDARYALKNHVSIQGSGDYSKCAGSDIVVVTAGLVRKPGMKREDLLLKNAGIVSDVCEKILEYARDAIVIVVSNPVDAMTHLAFRKLKFPRGRVFGMGVSLDTSRFANLIAKKLDVKIQDVEALVIGNHAETMVPLARLAKVKGQALSEILEQKDLDELVARTKKRGAEIVALYASGSAYLAPSAAIFEIVKTILKGETKQIPVSVFLEGEYGLAAVTLGVLARIGQGGMEKVLQVDLNLKEEEAFKGCAESVKESITLLEENGL